MVSAPQVQDGQWGAGSKRQSGLDVRGRGSFAGIEDPAVTTLELKCCGEHSGVRPAAAGRQLTPQHGPQNNGPSVLCSFLVRRRVSPPRPTWAGEPLA